MAEPIGGLNGEHIDVPGTETQLESKLSEKSG
jgi:hypothetical protein